MRWTALAVILALSACGGSAPAAAHSPTASSTAGASESPAPPASPTAGPAALVHCTSAVPAGDNLVIGTVAGDPTVVVRDIQDPAHAKNLCVFDGAAQAPQFVSGTVVAYETPDHQIITADLASGATMILASYTSGFDSGQYAFSPDGKQLTYLDSNQWRSAGPTGNKVLATLPAAPGRGISQDQDDSFLGFSPDGKYIAYFQTFHLSGGPPAGAPDEIRDAKDGKLVYSTASQTMAVWASSPSRLYFQDGTGADRYWDAGGKVTSIGANYWIRPRASPDGRWIAFTRRPKPGAPGVIELFSVQAQSVSKTLPAGRSGVRFLTNDLIWYAGERACSTCFGGQPQPTGVTYIYSIAGASEVTSRLSQVYDAWPRVTAPAL